MELLAISPNPIPPLWISPGVSRKPSYCANNCPYASIGSGFCPDDYPNNPLIAVLLEAPGETEILERSPLTGRAGKLWIHKLIEKLGYHRSDVLIANTLRCRPPENRYPTGDLRTKAEQACRYWDKFHGENGVPVASGISSYAPTICVLSYHPAAILRTPALYKPTLRSMELAFKFALRGERPVVAMGDVPASLLAPWIVGKGGLKVWNRHYFRMSGWPFNTEEKKHEIESLHFS